MHTDVEYILLDQKTIEEKVTQLAGELERDYQGKELVMVGILKGSFVFFADLVRKINLDFMLDFMIVSSYGDGTTSGNIRFIKGLDKDIAGKHLVIVEDIIDSGRTLSFLKAKLLEQGAGSVAVCTLLDKPSRRVVDLLVGSGKGVKQRGLAAILVSRQRKHLSCISHPSRR